MIHFYDLSAVVKNKLLLYADDSVILVSHTYFSKVNQCLAGGLNLESQWLIASMLSLHLEPSPFFSV